MDKVICAHYEVDFVVDHECCRGVVSGTESYREACHKEACLQHKGRLMFCPEREQSYSPENIIQAACARMRNNASGSETQKKSMVGNIEKLPKNGSMLPRCGFCTTSMIPIVRWQIMIQHVKTGYATKIRDPC